MSPKKKSSRSSSPASRRSPSRPGPAASRPRKGTAAARPRKAKPSAPAEAPVAPDLQPAPPPVFGDIPWGYGENRVTPMARDPYWMFVSWEVTDEAIERARAEVGAPGAPCVLRVYDTTYRLFDGTNANWFMDVAIHRPANNHYVLVNRPGTIFHVDIGVRNAEGRFATIARAGPVEMPRDSIAADSRVEWMKVTSDGTPGPSYRHRYVPRPGAPREHPGIGPDVEIERIGRALAGEGWSRFEEWTEADMGGRPVRWIRWIGPFGGEPWRIPEGARVEIVFEGDRRVIRWEQGERLTFGPWSVTIRGLDPRGARRIIDRWAIHYAWERETGAVRVETAPILIRILHGYQRPLTAVGSEARLIGESWASEALQLGASEWRWRGAAEARFAGASESLYLGASEALLIGASRFLGASEVALGEASRFEGASEVLLGGGSLFSGASEAGSGPLPSASGEERRP